MPRSVARTPGVCLLAGLLVALAALAPSAAPGPDPAPSPVERLRAASRAFEAGDETALVALARDPTTDVFRVAGYMRAWQVTNETGADASAAVRLLAAFARGAGETPRAARLRSLVDAWGRDGPEQLAAERKLLETHRAMRKALRSGDADRVDALARALPGFEARDAHSLFSVSVEITRANAWRRRGQGARAAAILLPVARRARALGWSARAATLHLDAGDLLAEVEPPAADAAYVEAMRDFDAAGDRRGRARAEISQAALASSQGAHDAARAQVRRARDTLLALGAAGDAALALSEEGLMQGRLGDTDAGARLVLQAHAELEAAGRPRDALIAGLNASTLLQEAGRLPEALRLHEQLAGSLRRMRDGRLAIRARLDRTSLHMKLRDWRKSLALSEEVVAIATETRDRESAARARGNMAFVHLMLGAHEKALSIFDGLVAEPSVADDPRWLALTHAGRARALKHLDRLDDAHHAHTQAQQAARRAHAPRLEAGTYADHGYLLMRQERAAEALAAFEKAGTLLDGLGHRGDLRASVHHGAGGAHLLLAQLLEAMASFDAALEIDRLGTRGLADDHALALRREAHETSEQGIETVWRWRSEQNAPLPDAARRAFGYSESGRGLLLAAGIGNAEALLEAELPEPLREADRTSRGAVEIARRALVRVLSGQPFDDAQVAQARATLDAAWNRRRDVIARIQREARRLADVVYPSPATLQELQQALDPDTVYVAYHVAGPNIFAIVVTDDKADFGVTSGARAILEDARAWLRLVATPGGPEAALATRLAERLVPFAKYLRGRSRLVIAPDGMLTFLPFGALRHEGGALSGRLVEHVEITLVPSATTWLLLRKEAAARPPGTGLLALGDPRYAKNGPFAPLPGSGAEVTRIAALFAEEPRTVLRGADASVDALTAALERTATEGRRLRALHLACHALIDPERPRLSAFALADGALVDMDRLYGLRIPADLAVLSACETGRGRLADGEGAMGFVRGFLFAGVPRVVVSNWKVPDTTTGPFMHEFYAALLKPGQGPAAALRAAQLARLKAGGPAAHPYTWAGFTLWGLAESQ